MSRDAAAAFIKEIDCAVKILDSGWFWESSKELSRGVPFEQNVHIQLEETGCAFILLKARVKSYYYESSQTILFLL